MNEQHDRSISTAIRRLAGVANQQRIQVVDGNVQSVNVANRSCVVLLDNGVEIDCKLMYQIGDGFLLIPSVDSTVLVMLSTYIDAVVLMCSDLDMITMKGDELGGLVKVENLTEKLNALENKVNEIITTFNLHSHPSNGAPPATQITGTITPTVRSDLENESIKHGS